MRFDAGFFDKPRGDVRLAMAKPRVDLGVGSAGGAGTLPRIVHGAVLVGIYSAMHAGGLTQIGRASCRERV